MYVKVGSKPSQPYTPSGAGQVMKEDREVALHYVEMRMITIKPLTLLVRFLTYRHIQAHEH